MARRVVVILLLLLVPACGDCQDSASEAADMGHGDAIVSDSATGGTSSGGSHSVPVWGYAGVPGECTSDEECLALYEGSGWPYAEPGNLTCATDAESGLGYCTECRTSADCADEHHCHDERFCFTNEKYGAGCRSHEECKEEADENPAKYGVWSPVHPIKCIPTRELPEEECSDCAPAQNATCKQCVSDADCTPGGRCLNEERCYEPCETTEDCLEGWHCNDNLLCVRD